MGYSPPGSSVHGISQAQTLERVAISISRVSFPTQGLNPGLLHWESPRKPIPVFTNFLQTHIKWLKPTAFMDFMCLELSAATAVRHSCALVSPADIKRLAEKEDWVVDSEGLTSLVSLNSSRW